jgi:membrane protein
MPAFIRIAWKVVFDAVWHFSEDDGWAMASHVALSTLLAIFPFLIFGTALGSFLGADQFATTAVHFIFDTWPESIAKPISNEVVRVLTIPRGGLLTLSVLAAAYFASNGVEALRVSLNRAYRVAESRAWYKTRVASLAFVLAGVLVLAIVSLLLVAVPARHPLCRHLSALVERSFDHDRQLEPCRRFRYADHRPHRQPSLAAGRTAARSWTCCRASS